jgi:tetratricopeptide (TPR) repeat protein
MDGRTFLQFVRPLLESGDPDQLVRAIRQRMTVAHLCSLLLETDVDVRRAAAMVLGYVGDLECVPCLVRALQDADEQVNQLAENSLLLLWFQAGTDEAGCAFRRGVRHFACEQYREAIKAFERAIAIDPYFAEAHNQCALAHYFLEQWRDSARHYQAAIRIAPAHFPAIAGLGHCYLEVGDMKRAVQCFKRALTINPRMSSLTHVVERLEARLARRNDESGIFESMRV